MKLVVAILLPMLLLFYPAYAEEITGRTEAEIQVYLEKHAPEIAEEARRLKPRHPSDYREVIDEARRAIAEFTKVNRFSPEGARAYWEMYRTDFEAVWYSDQIAEKRKGIESDELKTELKKLIGQSFDYWLIYEKSKLKKIQADLARAETQLKQHEVNRLEIIAEDTESLIEESRRYLKEKKTGTTKR